MQVTADLFFPIVMYHQVKEIIEKKNNVGQGLGSNHWL